MKVVKNAKIRNLTVLKVYHFQIIVSQRVGRNMQRKCSVTGLPCDPSKILVSLREGRLLKCPDVVAGLPC